RLVVAHDRLEIGVLDDHELALRDLPALDELVARDLAVVHRAPALLLDRRPALPVQGPEADVRGPPRRLRRQCEADRNVDQAKADRAVPGRPHRSPRSLVGPGVFALPGAFPAT